MKLGRLASVVLGAAIVISCGGGGGPSTQPEPADPGPINIVLSSPSSNDGAVLVHVTGGTVSSIAATGYELGTATPGPDGVQFIVRGTVTSGVIARIEIPDRNKLSSYQAVVVQAAARGTYVQQALAGYAVTLTR